MKKGAITNFKANLFCKSLAYFIIYVFLVQSCIWMTPYHPSQYQTSPPESSNLSTFASIKKAFRGAINLLMPSEAYAAADILVNDKSGDTESMASFNDNSIAMDWQGNFVIVWRDNRNINDDIWLQMFDSDNNHIGGNKKANDDLGTNDQASSQVAMDKNGNFTVVWHDNRNGGYDIYAQRYDSLGNPIGANFRVNESPGTTKQVSPRIGMDSNGNFVVVWNDGRDGGQDIYAQRFDKTGTPLGTNIRVNEDEYSITGVGYINVSMSDTGIFGVTWSTREGTFSSSIYVRLFDWNTGQPVAPTSTVETGYLLYPHICIDHSGVSTVIFSRGSGGPLVPHWALLMRRYDLSGDPITTAYIVDDISHQAWMGWSNGVGIRPNGEFVICFKEGITSPLGYSHRIRRFDAAGTPLGPSFYVASGSYIVSSVTPNGLFSVFSGRSGLRYDWSESLIGEYSLAGDNDLSQMRPKVAMVTPDTYIIAWNDVRVSETDSNYYARLFKISGDTALPLGEEFNIPGDAYPMVRRGLVEVSGSGNGRFVAIGNPYKTGWSDEISIRVYDVSGTLLTSRLHKTTWNPELPDVAMCRSHDFVIAKKEALLKKGEGYETDIFLTFFNPNADVIKDIRVNPKGDNGASQTAPQVAMNNTSVIVAWNDPREGRDDIWARAYSFPDGGALTDEFRVHEDISQTGHYLAGIAMDDQGRFIITWNDRREGDWNVYARRFNPDFTPMAPEYKINDDGLPGVEQKGGDVIMTSSANGDYAITWDDWRDGDPDIYIRLYNGDGTPKGPSFRMTSTHDSHQVTPAIAATEDLIFATWMDNRNGDWDVYARLRGWDIYSFTMGINPENLEIEYGDTGEYTIIVENDGGIQDSYELEITGLPDNFTREMQASVQGLPAGEHIEVPLRIIPPHDMTICSTTPYPFRVTVTSIARPDSPASAEAQFTVTFIPHSPTASANGPYFAAVGESIILDGSGSYDIDEPEGDSITAYGWEIDYSTPLDFDDATGVSPTLPAFDAPGTYPIGLRVVDNTANTFPFTGSPNLTGEDYSEIIVYDSCILDLYVRPKGTKASLVWTHIGADEYKVYRSAKGPNTEMQLIGTINSTYTTFLDYNVELYKDYWYRVQGEDGVDICGSSAYHIKSQGRIRNNPPQITSDPILTAREAQTYTYDVEARDPEGDSISYFLDQYPNRMTIDSSTGLIQWTPLFSQIGENYVTVRATDSRGASATQFFIIIVEPRPNLAPIADPDGPYSGLTGQVIAFDGSGSYDPDNDLPLSYQWNFGDGSTSEEESPVHTYSTGGHYTVTLYVTDSRGATGSAETTAHINTPPMADADGPYTGPAQAIITFDGSGSYDPDGDTLTYTWDFGDGSASSTGRFATHTYANQGTYTVAITVNDGQGQSDTDTTEVMIGPPNNPPVAQFTSQDIRKVGEDFYFDASASHDPDGDIVTYYWDFGDGVETMGVILNHSYDNPGNYTVSLTVTDDDNATDTARKTLSVVLNLPPQIVSSPVTSATEGTLYNYDVEAMDPDGDTLTYSLPTAPSKMTIDSTTGLISWIPTRDQTGDQNVSLSVEDGHGNSDSQAYTIQVVRTTTIVPNVIGMTQAEAESALSSAFLVTGAISNTYNNQIPAGSVASQDPDAGTVEALQSPVNLFISLGEGFIDLEPTSLDLSGISVDSQTLEITGTVDVAIRNNEISDVIDIYELTLFEDININQNFDRDKDNILGSSTIPNAPLGNDSITVTVDISGSILFSGNLIYAFVDSSNQIEETDETNNLMHNMAVDCIDLTASYIRLEIPHCSGTANINARIGNGGTLQVSLGVDISFYDGDPAAGGVLLGTVQSSAKLDPGHYEDVTFTWNDPTPGIHAIHVIADDDGNGTGSQSEVDENNNLASAAFNVILISDEVCDGIDNDCDGEIDENLNRDCSTNCGSGTETCYKGIWINCTAPQPEEEVCDGVDNDCDGEIDEGVLNACGECGPVTAETCDGVDNDCDGAIDEGFDADSDGIADCFDACPDDPDNDADADGVCGDIDQCPNTPPVVRVDNNGCEQVNHPPQITEPPVSSAAVGVPYNYTVSATDPDGDTLSFSLQTMPDDMIIDPVTGMVQWMPTAIGSFNIEIHIIDGWGGSSILTYTLNVYECLNGSTRPCSTICGEGVETCLNNVWQACDAPQPTEEVCDGEDNDCDGQIDEGVLNACGECGPVPDEICDGIDNNCDGQIDEGVLNACGECGPVPDEVCDGIDNNCDGNVDEGFDLDGDRFTSCNGDCDDNDETIFPGAQDICDDGSDQDCNGFDAVCGDVTPPTVEISSPEPDSEVIQPTDIIGTADDTNFARYRLEYSPVRENSFTTFATGDFPVINGVLGQLDPTLLVNGMYTIRLIAEDASGQLSANEIVCRIDGMAKVGIVQLSFIDMDIPALGIPIRVSRTYDSRIKTQGDFGIGWDLAISQGFYEHNRPPGKGWQIVSSGGIFPLPCLQIHETLSHFTEVRLSDGEFYLFSMTLESPSATIGGCFANARFEFVDGTIPGAKLHILGNTEVTYQSGFNHVIDRYTGELYNPRQVRLTTIDGRIIDLDHEAGITRVQDLNGNSFTINPNGIVHSTGRSIIFTRDSQGRIIRITDPLNNTVEYEYDASGDLVSVTDQVKEVVRFVYSNSIPHHLIRIIAPDGKMISNFGYDNDGRLIRTCDDEDNCTNLEHDIANRTETVIDPTTRTVFYTYDERGNILSATDGLNNTTTFEYDDEGNLIRTIDANGSVTRYTYDDYGNQLSVTRPHADDQQTADYTTYFTYNERNQLTSVTRPTGAQIKLTYDAAGNLTSLRDETDNIMLSYVRGPGGVVTEEGSPFGSIKYVNDSFGNPIQTIDLFDNVMEAIWDVNAQLKTMTDGNNIYTFEYDDLGRETFEDFDDGITISYTYDIGSPDWTTLDSSTIGHLERQFTPSGQPALWVKQDNSKVTFKYDGAGRLLEEIGLMGYSTRYRYDLAGRLVEVKDDLNNNDFFEYDPTGKLIKRVDALDNETKMTYAEDGSLASETNARNYTWTYSHTPTTTTVRDPLGRETTTVFSPHGLPIETIGPACATTKLNYLLTSPLQDAEDYLTSIDDGSGHIRTFTYNSFGQLASATDLAGTTYTYTYDEGDLISMTGPTGETLSYSYNDDGDLETITYPDNTVKTFTYGLLAFPKMVEKPSGVTVTFEYDVVGNLVSSRSSKGEEINFSWNVDGTLDELQDTTGTTKYTYNMVGDLTAIHYPNGAVIGYERDVLGQVIQVEVLNSPDSDKFITKYSYDGVGNLVKVIDPLNGETVMEYDQVNRLINRTLPNGVITSYEYNECDQITSIVHKGPDGAVLASVTYERQGIGEPYRILREDGSYVMLTYDNALRLTKESYYDASDTLVDEISYTYDAAGNRLHKSTVSGNLTYSYQPGYKLVSVSGPPGDESYVYDTDGRVTSITRHGKELNLVYNTDDRLMAVHDTNSGILVEYTYDGVGRRVRVKDSSGEFQHTVGPALGDGLESLHITANEAGNLITEYVYAGEYPIMRIGVDGPIYYLTDALGSVIALVDGTGINVASFHYDGFGNLRSASGTAVDAPPGTGGDFRFQGAWLDTAAGFYYLRERYYDPCVGRFLSRDQADPELYDPITFHPYIFANSNPYIYRDPTGLFTLLEILTVIDIQKTLRAIKIHAADEVRTELRGFIGMQVAEKLRPFLKQYLPLVNNAITKILQGPHLSTTPGNLFEAGMKVSICEALQASGFSCDDHVYFEVAIKREDGAPQNNGYTCKSIDKDWDSSSFGKSTTGNIKSQYIKKLKKPYHKPDFIFRRERPMRYGEPRKNPKQYLVGDFKLSVATFIRDYKYSTDPKSKHHQFDAIIMNAKNYSYIPFALFGTFFSGNTGGGKLNPKQLKILKDIKKRAAKKGVKYVEVGSVL